MIPDRYNGKNFINAIKNPHRFITELYRLGKIPYYLGRRKIHKTYFFESYEPTDVIEQDWDNLIILDACRFDKFFKVNDIEGNLSKIISQGSHSEEFISKTFNGRELHDTIYISANPYSSKGLDKNTFYKTVLTYDSEKDWNQITDMVHPKKVLEIEKKNIGKTKIRR